jgi:hypothetical protein
VVKQLCKLTLLIHININKYAQINVSKYENNNNKIPDIELLRVIPQNIKLLKASLKTTETRSYNNKFRI